MGVVAWIEATDPSRLFVTSISMAETLLGLALMPEGKRKLAFAGIMHTFFTDRIRTPVLAFGGKEAEHFAKVVSHRQRIGRPIGEFDAQIAAIALAQGFAVVTRNERDFSDCGVTVINPWEQQ